MELGKQIKAKRTDLNITVKKLAVLLDLNFDSIYKWEKGTSPSDYNDNVKLNAFIAGVYDRFIKNGRLVEGYNYEDAIKILYPRQATNDYHPGMESIHMAHEPIVPIGNEEIEFKKILLDRIKDKDEIIQMQRKIIAELEEKLASPVSIQANKKIS